jgi:hypothetical protein
MGLGLVACGAPTAFAGRGVRNMSSMGDKSMSGSMGSMGSGCVPGLPFCVGMSGAGGKGTLLLAPLNSPVAPPDADSELLAAASIGPAESVRSSRANPPATQPALAAIPGTAPSVAPAAPQVARAIEASRDENLRIAARNTPTPLARR